LRIAEILQSVETQKDGRRNYIVNSLPDFDRQNNDEQHSMPQISRSIG
jgi:hypothetical protein